MSWLQTADTAVFRFINQTLSNPVLDLLMPVLAGVVWFVPVVAALGVYLVWKGGLRGRLFVTMLALLILLGDTLIINQIKKAVSRERPSNALADARVSPSVGKGSSESMPSSHASTWAAAALIAFAYYPRSRRFMIPMAGLMAFSRVYLGVHFPSDTIAGLILGAGYAAFGLWTLNAIWQWAGPKWFPDWCRLVPCLVVRENVQLDILAPRERAAASPDTTRIADQQYLVLGYTIIGALLLFRLLYVASDKIELSETEAYQWLWSKHLALSYHGAPPGIAILHFISNQIWGDTHLGVRFFSPILSAVLSVVVMRFFAREVGGQSALALMLALTATPLFAAGSVLMTSGTPLVLFWTLSMLAGWRAIQPDAGIACWGWVGLWSGLALLFDYGAFLLIPCWALIVLLSPTARTCLRRPGPWLALGIAALGALPLLISAKQHGIGTVFPRFEPSIPGEHWAPTLKHLLNAAVLEVVLLNPVFSVGALWAVITVLRIQSRPDTDPLWLFFFATGVPVFLGCWFSNLFTPAPLQWMAPTVVPLFCLMMARWDRMYRSGVESVKVWVVSGVALGAVAIVFLHDTDLLRKTVKLNLPPAIEPLRRVREIESMVAEVAQVRSELRRDGRETFVIAGDPGLAGQLTFYLPEARASLPMRPLVYALETTEPRNQFFFWPEYRYTVTRKGADAVFVATDDGIGKPPPEIVAQFESVTDLGEREIKRGRRTFHTLRLFACRNLR